MVQRWKTAALVGCGAVLAMGVATAVPATAAPQVSAPQAAAPHAAAAVHRVLFDDSKAEEAGNADWIISTSMPDPTQQNANPQSETDWTGALSSWGVALQQAGDYQLDTLPPGNTITFGTTNALDLSNFDVLVLPEPNVLLSAAEKTAVMKFVQGGGGLFFITDHTGSDRNNDGADAVDIANDLMTNNSVDSTDPFGLSVDLKDISSDHPVAISSPGNPVLDGPFGTVTHSLIADGTTFTLKPADNPNVAGLLHLSTSAAGDTGNTFVTSTFGAGRVAFWDDSSPIDDGTGQAGNDLFVGWADPTADNAALGLNATQWLAQGGAAASGVSVTNPGNQSSTVGTAVSLAVHATDSAGGTLSYAATGLPAGLAISGTTGAITGTPTTTGSGSVTVTATDSGGTSGSTTFTWAVTQPGAGCTAAQLLGNPGFETGSAPWSATTGVIFSSAKEPAHTGSFVGWLDGRGVTTTDTLSQSVSIPATCTAADFSFWLHIDTAEPTTSAFDNLSVQVLNSAGTVLSTLGTFSNQNAVTGYLQHSFSLASVIGQTVTLKFTGAEDFEKQTSFVVDDTALNVS